MADVSAHYKATTALLFSPDGSTLVSGGDDATIHAWRMLSLMDAERRTDPGYAAKPYTTWVEHTLGVTSLRSCNSSPARFLSSSLDGTVRLWELGTPESLDQLVYPTAIHVAVADSLGSTVFAGGSDGSVHVRPWGGEDADAVSWGGHAGAVVDLTTCEEGTQLVTASRDGTCRFWDCASGQTLRTLRLDSVRLEGHGSRPQRGAGSFTAVASVGSRAATTDLHARAEAASAIVAPLQVQQRRRDDMVLREPLSRGAAGIGSVGVAEEMDAELDLLQRIPEASKWFLEQWVSGKRPRTVGGQREPSVPAQAPESTPSRESLPSDVVEEISALRAQIERLHDENARWQALNSALLANKEASREQQPRKRRRRE